jgi:MFS family permease
MGEATPTSSTSRLETWAALIAVSLAIFTITLDGTMMPVAIGSIVGDLKIQVGFVQGAMALHSLVMASAYLAAGKLADRLGEKRILTVGAVLFGAGVVVAAASPNVWVLLLGWSLIKPLGGAMMIPAAASLIVINYAGRQRTLAFGIFSAFVAAAAVIGPLWMGLIASTLSWRWGLASEPLLILLVWYFASLVTEKERDTVVAFDTVGSALTFVGLGLIVLGSTLAGELGWWHAKRPLVIGGLELAPLGFSAALVFILAGAMVLVGYGFWAQWRQRRGLAPIFRVGLLKNRILSVGTLMGVLFNAAVGGLLFVLPVFMQSALYLGALQTGLVLLPYTLGIFLFALGTSRIPATVSPFGIVRAGLTLMLAGAFWVHHTASLTLNWGDLIPALFCMGAGAGMVLSRLTDIALSRVPPEALGEATGGNATGKELGGAFGVAVLGSIFMTLMYGNVVDRYDAYHHLPEASPENRQQAILELEDWASRLTDEQWRAFLDSLPEATGIAYQSIVNHAYLGGYQTTLLIIAALIATVLVLSLLLSSSLARKKPDAPTD